jgi:hypothetical protein
LETALELSDQPMDLNSPFFLVVEEVVMVVAVVVDL